MPPSRDHDRDDRATISVFGTVSALVIATLYYIGRLGFENPARPVLATLGLSLFITVTPFVAWRLSVRGHYEEPEPWWRSHAVLMIAALTITALAGMLVPATGVNLVAVLATIGLGSALAAFAIWIAQGSPRVNLLFVIGSAAFALWAGGVTWSTRYKTPVFWELFEYKANVHHDTLYNVSLANMMRSYGVPSTGLDGVPYIPYHYGASWLNSDWAYLAGTDVLGFYSLAPVIVLPVFFVAVLLLAVEVRKGWRLTSPGADPALKKDWAAWFLFLAVTVGLIPTAGLDAMGIWNLHAFISESYVSGVPVLLLVMAAAIAFWRRKRSSLRTEDILFLFVFAPVMLSVLGFLKVSLMLLLLCAAMALAVLGRMLRDRLIALSAILCVATSFVTYKLVSVAAQNQGFVPFAFMRYSGVDATWWPWFILAHLFWSWVYIYLRLREEKLTTIGGLRHATLEGRITDVVVVAIIAIAGFLPGEIVEIHGGSAIYFSDVQRWLALPLLMATAWRWVEQWRERRGKSISAGTRLGGVRVSDVWLALLLIPISVTMLLNGIRAPVTALKADVALRRSLYEEAGVKGAVGLRSLADRSLLATGLHRAPDYSLIFTLRELAKMPTQIKRRTLVFIPQSYSHFWQAWANEAGRCSFVPLIVPAASSLALLDGMPPVDCDLTNQYGMTRYSRRTTPQSPRDVVPDKLCRMANAKGFSRVVIIDGPGGNDVDVRGIDCLAISK
jgi:hypothetical protein